MQEAGITGVGDTAKDKRDLAKEYYQSAIIQDVPLNELNVITESSPLPKKEKDRVPLIDQFDNFMTSFGKNKINIPFPSIATFGASALQGMNATNVLLNKLNKGLELDSSDKVALVTLTNNMGTGDVINEYAKKNELSTDELFDLHTNFDEQAREILGRVEDEGDNIIDWSEGNPFGEAGNFTGSI